MLENGCAIKIAYSTIPAAFNFTTPTYVQVANPVSGGTPGYVNITSYNTPALTAQNGFLFLAYNDASNNNYLISSNNGVNWSSPYRLSSPYPTTWAPSLAADAHNANRIYAGFSSASTYTPIICAIYPNSSNLALSAQTCYNFSSLNQMNYNPGLYYYSVTNQGVTMAYAWRGDQHCLYGYILDPETEYSYDYNASLNCSDQTSTSPSLSSLNGNLYIAFGGNNSNRQFNIRYSNYANGPYYLNSKQTFQQGMNGQPNLITISASGGYYPELVNFYVWNGQLRYLYLYN